ncbi:divergent PAP2 family protein [bacterium]|jgi:acid phosphatase family membrane protein YuiD|nr:MAG: divergent PAP2 family protein [bacterium]
MKEMFARFFMHNRILSVTIVAWVFTQTIKVTLGVIREKKFNFRWFIGTGGMPSSHAAGATALALSSGLELGFSSPIFALAFVFAMVTMFDAQGVRRSAGKQAEILNKIIDDIHWRGKIKENKLKELLGHTPIQVIAGSIIGALIALALSR